MRLRLRRLLAADTTWLEIGFAALTCFEGLSVLRVPGVYASSAVFAPVSWLIPYWVVGGIPVVVAGVWAVGLWQRLGARPGGISLRFLASAASFVFWIGIAVLFRQGAPAGQVWLLYTGHAALQILLFYRLWAEWSLRPAPAPDRGAHADA